MKQKILFLLLLISVGINLFLIFNNPETSTNAQVPIGDIFAVDSNVICTVYDSKYEENIGTKLFLSNLNSDIPRMSSEGSGDGPMNKLYESETILTIGWVATGTGSTDVIQINKENSQFVRTETSHLLEPYGSYSIGTCY